MSAAVTRSESADLAVHADWVIPVEPHASVLKQHCVVVRDGRILALLPSDEARRRFAVREVVELPSHVLIPGFVNAQAHAVGRRRRAPADEQHAEPMPTAAGVRDSSQLAMACMLRSGTTCFSGAIHFPEAAAEAIQRAGMRACLGLRVSNHASPWASDAREYLAKGMAVRDQYRDHPRLTFAFAPEHAWDLPDDLLGEIRTLADELDVPIQARLHASSAEITQCLEQHAQRPLMRLAALGWLTPNFDAIEMNCMTPDDAAVLADTGAHVIHCPAAGSRCPVTQLRDAGTNVALGTGAGIAFDMFECMHAAALLAGAVPLSATTLLRMATLDGAHALGLAEYIGSLEPGKWADMAAIDLNAPETQPLYNPLSQLVHAAQARQVSEVWIAGESLLRQGELARLDLDSILGRARCAG